MAPGTKLVLRHSARDFETETADIPYSAFFFDLPVKNGRVQPAIVAKWAANAPLAMVDQYATNLRRYKAIAMDVGLQDNLLTTNRELDALLQQAGVKHTFETYEGDHNNKVAERFDTKVLPFFSNQLSFH